MQTLLYVLLLTGIFYSYINFTKKIYIIPMLHLTKLIKWNLIHAKLNLYILILNKIYSKFNSVKIQLLTNRNFYANILKIK